MSKFSVLIALCFFFCVASAQFTDPVVEFDAGRLTPGTNLSIWENTGSLGGSVVSADGVPVLDHCGNALQGLLFSGESFQGVLASPITFSASDAAVVIVVASSTGGATSGIITTAPAAGASGPAELGPGALFDGAYTQDGEDTSSGLVNTFSAASGAAVALAFVYETPIGTTANDFWITPDASGSSVIGLGTNVANTFGSVAIGDRLGATGFSGCIHYLAIYQVLTTPVNEDALSATLLELAIEFDAQTNVTTSSSPAPRTTGSTTGSSTTGSTSGTTGTTGSRTTGRRTTHVSSATIPAVPSLLFAAIVSFFLFFLC